MKIELISDHDDFLLIKNIWNGLLEKSLGSNVFLTFEWLECWWRAFGKNKKLNVLLLKDGELVSGIAPLMQSPTKCIGLPVKKISFIYNENASSADFILYGKREEMLRSVIVYLKANKKAWDLIELQNIAKDSPNREILEKILTNGDFSFGIKEGLRSPYIPIDSDWQSYFSKRRKKFRKTLRNIANRITKFGLHSIEKLLSPGEDKRIMNDIFRISAMSWKAKHKKDIAHKGEERKFFEELCNLTSKNGWLRLWFLKINGVRVAYELHLKYNSRIYALKADFDDEYKRVSPGSFLDTHIVQHYFNDRIKEYDLCGHHDAYKKNWTSLIREHATFMIYNDSLYGRIIYVLDYKFLYTLKLFLKKIKFIRKLRKNPLWQILR